MLTSNRKTPAHAAFALGGLLAIGSLPATPAAAQSGLAPQPKAGEPLLGLTPEQLARFQLGKNRYASAITEEAGLGPIYNQFACGFCHNNPLGGTGTVTVLRFAHVDEDGFDPLLDLGGPVRQELSNDAPCRETIPVEANLLRVRVTNGAMGYGFIEAIPDADILALESTGTGISGRAHMVEALEDPGVPRVGRFGWKSILPTILSFSADAARNELGLTNRLVPDELDPNGSMPPSLDDPDFCDLVADPEDGPEGGVGGAPHFIDRVTDFQRFMSAPPQAPRSGMSGEAIFDSIGCVQCHHRSFTTSDDPSLEAVLRSQVIQPYSDFLLHDMGDAGDDYPEGDALGSEVRTTPLWGLRHRQELWHDGRFDDTFEVNVVNAILEHGDTGSEAVAVVNAWNDLTDEERDSVVAFLASLGHLEFDHDHDNKIDFADFLAFAECFTGPGVFYDADDPCALSDVDQDGDVDVDDYDSFLIAYLDEGLGPQDDCNENGVIDLTDIITGTSLDEDSDGIPDDCETTPILELVLTPSGTYLPGDTIEVTLWMRELGVYEAVAFQAFLSYDDVQMDFVSGVYTETPFGLPIITPIAGDGGEIDLSAGTDPLGGQTATSADEALVVLTFEANEVFCVPTVAFRASTPPTRISLDDGTAADPIILIDLQPPTCPADLNNDDDVGYFDLVTVLASWGPCTTTCAGDLDCDQQVGFGDLLTVLASWGPCN